MVATLILVRDENGDLHDQDGHLRNASGLSAPSAAPAVMSKGRKRPSANPDAATKRKCVEAGPLPTRASGSGSASRHRAKFISLIDGKISEFGSEAERLAKESEESREKSSQVEGKMKVIEDAHSLEAARVESRIGVLERDLGKTGGANEVGEAHESPRVEGAMLPVCAEGDYDLILMDLKSECVLPSCSSEPVGQDLVAGDA
ncbi:hypothetical protein F2Q68_00039229 [Brassica cretica]|uniref:Uncharacterized protein n=1 Tax=Brassica cretica TaxID=69181 RepID=A0A8S9MTE5_BRACR|nr:hypothetical protein F2Q68_00039229 [Brassica cretica]